MKKIIKYEVVSLELDKGLFIDPVTENDFTKMIDKKLKEGFQPYGDLKISVETSGSFAGSSSRTRLSQVMVKYED